jgi:hypothetical protein
MIYIYIILYIIIYYYIYIIFKNSLDLFGLFGMDNSPSANECRIDSKYSHVCGLDMPELLLREAYIVRPDITFQALHGGYLSKGSLWLTLSHGLTTTQT